MPDLIRIPFYFFAFTDRSVRIGSLFEFFFFFFSETSSNEIFVRARTMLECFVAIKFEWKNDRNVNVPHQRFCRISLLARDGSLYNRSLQENVLGCLTNTAPSANTVSFLPIIRSLVRIRFTEEHRS